MQEETIKNRRHATAAAIFAALGVCAVALSACSTVEGAGEDIEYVGDQMSDTSRDAQN